MDRFEIRYDDTFMKHYFYDTELKAQVKFQDVCDFINQQDQKIKVLERALENIIKNIDTSVCFNCPINVNHKEICELESDKKECYEHIKDYFISQSKKEIKDE